MDYQKNARVFKALCDENRWKILDFLKNGEQCGCVLLNKLDISQSTLSHHMKILCDSGIVEGKKAGKWAHYSISQQGVAAAQELLAGLTINDLTDRQGCSCRASSGGICVQGKTKLYVLTGFLGSGKTTILLRLLDQLKGRRVVLSRTNLASWESTGPSCGTTISRWWKSAEGPSSAPA